MTMWWVAGRVRGYAFRRGNRCHDQHVVPRRGVWLGCDDARGARRRLAARSNTALERRGPIISTGAVPAAHAGQLAAGPGRAHHAAGPAYCPGSVAEVVCGTLVDGDRRDVLDCLAGHFGRDRLEPAFPKIEPRTRSGPRTAQTGAGPDSVRSPNQSARRQSRKPNADASNARRN